MGKNYPRFPLISLFGNVVTPLFSRVYVQQKAKREILTSIPPTPPKRACAKHARHAWGGVHTHGVRAYARPPKGAGVLRTHRCRGAGVQCKNQRTPDVGSKGG